MEDFFGLKRGWYTSAIIDIVSYVTFLPERRSAIIILPIITITAPPFGIATNFGAYITTGRKKAAEPGPGSSARPFITLTHDAQQGYVILSR